MKRTFLSLLSLILALLMLAPTLVACNTGNQGDDETGSGSSSETTDVAGSEGSSDESESDKKEDETGDDDDDTQKPDKPQIEGVFGDSIEYANTVANGVQSYYTTADRTTYTINNLNMSLEYNLSSSSSVLVNSIKNHKGGTYVENTMDVFVKLTNGTVIYSSETSTDGRSNIYRLGSYYYDVHFLDHNFLGDVIVNKETDLDPKEFSLYSKGVKGVKINDGEMRIVIGGGDPYIYMPKKDDMFTFSADEYTAIQFSIKSDRADSAQVYYISGGATGHTNDQSVKFNLINDGEYHTYTVILAQGKDYSGDVSCIRLDFDNASVNDMIYVKDLKLVDAKTTGPQLYLDRTFHTYSDKLHQELHFIATQKVTDIAELGMVTKIAKDTVDKLIVKDSADELHTTIEGVDWNTAEYVGFDIKGVGIFGYILPVHKNAGKITVELVDGYYVITQTTAPENGTIDPIAFDDPTTSANEHKEVNTSNDFFTGNRIYTDENHTFDAFIREADWERAPLQAISSEDYIGYDALRGAYTFNIVGTGFNGPFFYDSNYHYKIAAKIRSDAKRPIYIRTITDSGCLENAVVLDGKDMVLPIMPEVSKNFGGENEEPIFFSGDMTYGETVFPLMLPKDERVEITVLNLYQNWGAFPLKQLSSIQYFWPYYHLSVGTTETSCISPWYGARDLWTLPDFRSQSMPYWFELPADKGYSNQPQHTHAGYQYFLQYTDADGVYNATENISNVIDSSGPVYVDADMTYISDDGKIKIVYSHIEMPQTDELRAYYEINYEILEEVKIKDFAKDFSFYSFEGYSGYYQKMGYWAENGENDSIVYKETNGTKEAEKLVLGNDCPYVALYDLKTSEGSSWQYNNANMGFVIHSSDIVIDGVKRDDNFVVMGKNYVYSLSMDLGEVTLKPGDTININMIITPWGHYDTTTDTSMQNIRENSCLNPLSVSVANGEKIESVFVPKILSKDGKSAEFTLTGGTNNVVTRVYGFNKLTAPKIYELVDGQYVKNEYGKDEWVDFDEPTWVEYVPSSINAPDKNGNKHYYDGYYVYYDGNGQYSYAFAVDMTDADSRTFKVVAEESFKNWPVIDDSANESVINVFVPASNLFNKTIDGIKGIGKAELSEDGSYIRYYGDGLGTPEAYFEVFRNSGETVTGKYAVIKYRIPKNMKESNSFQFYTTTELAIDMPQCLVSAGNAYKNGEWHVMVVDLVARGAKHFKPADGGDEYYAQYLRFDIFNTTMSEDSYIDIAYIGLADDVAKVLELEKTQEKACEEVRVFGENNNFVVYDLAGNEIEGAEIIEGGYIAQTNNRDYKGSKTSYVSGIDFINGIGDKEAGDPAFNGYRSNEVSGVKVIDFDGPTHENAYLALAGWTCVYGGVEKYVWSADGGVTWYDAVVYPEGKVIAAATGGIKNAGDGHFISQVTGFNKDTYDASNYDNSVYQGAANSPAGIAAHLINYIGKTVDVTFAVVPKNDNGNICVIAHVTNVRVYASTADAEVGEVCDHKKASGEYTFGDDGDASTDEAFIVRTCKCGEVTMESSIPSYVLFLGTISNQKVAPTAMENSKKYVTIDANTYTVNGVSKAFKTDANGSIYLEGWMGVNGGVANLVYKVYDAEGNELTSDWVSTNAKITGNHSDLNPEMAKRNIEIKFGVKYTASLELASYLATNEKVTVKLAIECAGAPEGSNDRYVYMGEFTNVSMPQ